MHKTGSLLVLGWKSSLDPLAIVNLHQLRALSQLPAIDLYYRDPSSGTQTRSADCERPDSDLAFINGIPDVAAHVTCAYQIVAPVGTITAQTADRVITFIAPEHRLQRPAKRQLQNHAETLTREDNRVVVASRWSKDRLVENGFPDNKISIIPHGVDSALFAPLSSAERAEARGALGISDDEFVLLNLAGSIREAGLDLLLRAFMHLHNTDRRLRLVLAPLEPDRSVDHRAAVHAVARAHPELIQPNLLDGITVIQGAFGQSNLRYLYGAADCLVSPYRAEDFNLPVLEAIAVGTPVIVTAGGATDDYCDDDVAWRIPSQLRDESSATGDVSYKFIEPDFTELTEAIAEVASGRGFDRRRFAQARVRLLRTFTWEAAAARLAELALGTQDDMSPFTTTTRRTVPGLPSPTGQRFAAHGHPERLRRRPLRAKPGVQVDSHCLSVVVQGPCLRTALGDGTPAIDAALISIRQCFPHAQIVLSTWQGSNTDGLDVDDIVLSADPGALVHPEHKTNNFNRQLTSVNNGLAAASRPFCIKTRNDVLFTKATLCTKPLWPAAAELSLERRIWILSWGTGRLETSLNPFHPSDMVQYGLTDDLRRLWDVPAVTWADAFAAQPEGMIHMVPEQCLAVGYLRELGHDLNLQNTYDGRFEIVAASLDFMLGAFDVFDGPEEGIVLPPRFVYGSESRETPETLAELRQEYLRDRDATCHRIFRDYWQLVHHVQSAAA